MSNIAAGKVLTIKVLLSHSLTGSLIGRGGKAIQDLNDISDAKVRVSGNTDYYPGTSDRVVVVVGELHAVKLAQHLIWEMIALISSAPSPKEIEWNPREMLNILGQNDSSEVSGKITIPAAAGGLILGKGGANIQSISEASGAHVTMTSKEDAMFTHERVLTISGSLGSCVKCTELILQKLDEPAEPTPYINRGATYALPLSGTTAYGSTFATPSYGGYGNAPYGGHAHAGGRGGLSGGGGADDGTLAAETTTTFMVPDALVGNIFGRQGATMREIQSISRATVSVSARADNSAEGGEGQLRAVTITGPAANVQTAFMLLRQRLQIPANPRKSNRASGVPTQA